MAVAAEVFMAAAVGAGNVWRHRTSLGPRSKFRMERWQCEA
jgi:hypothetical protein